jgi:hypothetical protein
MRLVQTHVADFVVLVVKYGHLMRLLQQLDAEILVNEAVRGAPESLIGR